MGVAEVKEVSTSLLKIKIRERLCLIHSGVDHLGSRIGKGQEDFRLTFWQVFIKFLEQYQEVLGWVSGMLWVEVSCMFLADFQLGCGNIFCWILNRFQAGFETGLTFGHQLSCLQHPCAQQHRHVSGVAADTGDTRWLSCP